MSAKAYGSVRLYGKRDLSPFSTSYTRGHDHLQQFNREDLTTWDRQMAALTGIEFGGFDPGR